MLTLLPRVAQFAAYAWAVEHNPTAWLGNLISITPVYAKLSMGFC